MTRDEALLIQNDTGVDHFLGLDPGLAAAGLRPQRLDPFVGNQTAVVVVSDLASPLCVRALRDAHDAGVPTLLVMDGIVEYRNTHLNPRVGERFLRPAPVSAVACCGPADADRLNTFGNRAYATGLPRLATIEPKSPPTETRVLVATARTPAFNEDERRRLVGALRELRALLGAFSVPALWRLTGGLEREVGVERDERPLGDALAASSHVVTAPSTLLVESMLAGRATGLLHPFATERWQDADHVFEADFTQDDLECFLNGSPANRSLDRLCTRDGPARRVAELCARLARSEIPAEPATPVPSRRHIPNVRVKTKTPRVVSLVACADSPVGGVTTWSQRLGSEFARRGDFDFRTLFVARTPNAWNPSREHGWLDEHSDCCVLDPSDLPHEQIDTVRESIERLGADILLPNYFDVCYAAAAQLRPHGVRTIGIAHTDDEYYRGLLSMYSCVDGAVGVSDTICSWLRPMHPRVPTGKIVYGVPVAESPRTHDNDRPLRLAYIGRVVERQKRVSDLLLLIDGLERRDISYEFHLVGDGPMLGSWELAISERKLRSGSVTVHGGKSAEWVQEFLPTLDCSVLVSDAEGTSITMLECMGHGVVPCVTRVDSGVSEWVRDGETGATAPVGAPDTLADRIAHLAEDRGLLRRLSVNAWERAKHQSVGAMAEQYAELFRTVLDTPMVTEPIDLGVRLASFESRPLFADTHTPVVERWATERLREAGYRGVGIGEPGDRDDAAVVSTPEQCRKISMYRARGLGVARVPHLIDQTLPDRVELIIREAMARGRRRFAVYGIGRHTQRLASLFGRGLPFVAFADDAASERQRVLGLPVFTLDRLMDESRPDAVVISSDAWEEQMIARCEGMRRTGVEIIPLYTRRQKTEAA